MPDGASASTNSSTTAEAAVRFDDAIRLFKKETEPESSFLPLAAPANLC